MTDDRSRMGGESGAPTRELDPDLNAAVEELRSLSRGEVGYDPDRNHRARELRHLVGRLLVGRDSSSPEYPEPAVDALPQGSNLIEVGQGDLTPGLVRAAILGHGCLLVRGLIDADQALAMAKDIDLAFEARSALAGDGSAPEGYYEEFEPEPPYGFRVGERSWVEMGGGVLASDSPRLLYDLFAALDRVGFPELVRGYLGEAAMISAQKTTLRKAAPDVRGAWHQDGKFLGEIRALNLWLSLSRCGDEAPGLDIVPRRLEHLVAAGTESPLPIEISEDLVAEAAGDAGILRPIFEPGDALLFDELFLHQTGSDPRMPKPRFAVESWFFGPSAFPDGYAPLAA
jgi:hypothetical protein